MEHIYEYLIGGKKMNRNRERGFDELKAGDLFYIYFYDTLGRRVRGGKRQKINEIHEMKIERIEDNSVSRTFRFKGDFEGSSQILLDKLGESFIACTDTQNLKKYYATDLDVMMNHLSGSGLGAKIVIKY